MLAEVQHGAVTTLGGAVVYPLSELPRLGAHARVVAGQKAAYLKNMRRAVGAGLAALAASKVPDADWGDATCAAKDPEVRFVVLDEMPESVTHELINAWSDGFRLPTVVRNAFNNTLGCDFDYLDDDVQLKTKFGYLGGFNERDKAAFPWRRVRETLQSKSEKIYGSFGYGTGNYEPVHKAALRAIKARIVPDLFTELEYPGHVIFGSTNETEVSTSWHNAIDANLLFQLCGQKLWYTMEKLPEGQYPAVWNSTAGSGGPRQTSELSSSVKSTSIRLIFGRLELLSSVLEAKPNTLRRNCRVRSH